jgi:SAM-dependent methyltransferase
MEFESPEAIFTEYGYFSSYSDTWLDHAKTYCDKMTERFGLGPNSHIVELASNDGYLLQYFVQRGLRVLGIEPAVNVAAAAINKGVPTLVKFFGAELAAELVRDGAAADLITANNVLAQVPDLNSFVEGMKILLNPHGVITIEFPHLLRTMEGNQFDQVYHEHFSYFSLYSCSRALEAHGLRVFDVEELPTHGGSLRVYACHADDHSKPDCTGVAKVMSDELAAGLQSLDAYRAFARKALNTKLKFVEFLVAARLAGKKIAGYGAPGKGTTMLHYCGIGRDLIEYTVDRSLYKQGRFMPGTHIPIHAPERISETKPDYVVILPWNLKAEIMQQMAYIREWGGQFVIPIPEVTVC